MAASKELMTLSTSEQIRQRFIAAVRVGDNKTIKELLELQQQRLDDNSIPMDTVQAALTACAIPNGHLETVRLLVEKYHAMENLPADNWPVHCAAMRGKKEILKYFLDERRVSPDLKDDLGRSLLFCTIIGSKYSDDDSAVRCAEILLDRQPKLNIDDDICEGIRGIPNSSPNTALMLSAYVGSYPLIQFFSQRGANVNLLMPGNNAHALWSAVRGGHAEIVTALIDDFGATIHDHIIHSAFCYLTRDDEFSLRWQIVQEFCVRKFDVNAFPIQDHSLLMFCANNEYLKLYKKVLSLGANIEYRVNTPGLMQHNAMLFGLPLREIEARFMNGFSLVETPIFALKHPENGKEFEHSRAAIQQFFAEVRAGRLNANSCASLLRLGAHLNQRSAGLNTALHLVCNYAHINVIRVLLAYISKLPRETQIEHLSTRNKAGHTALDIVSLRLLANIDQLGHVQRKAYIQWLKIEKLEAEILKKETADYVAVSCSVDKLCQALLMNAIQPLVDTAVFNIRKTGCMRRLDQDMMMDLNKYVEKLEFASSPEGKLILLKIWSRASHSQKITELALIHHKQNTNKAETHTVFVDRDIKTNSEFVTSGIATAAMSATMASGNAAMVSTASTAASANAAPKVSAVSMAPALIFSPLAKFKQDQVAKIDNTLRVFSGKIQTMDGRKPEASDDLIKSLASLKEYAEKVKKHIATADEGIMKKRLISIPLYNNYVTLLTQTIDFYEHEMLLRRPGLLHQNAH